MLLLYEDAQRRADVNRSGGCSCGTMMLSKTGEGRDSLPTHSSSRIASLIFRGISPGNGLYSKDQRKFKVNDFGFSCQHGRPSRVDMSFTLAGDRGDFDCFESVVLRTGGKAQDTRPQNNKQSQSRARWGSAVRGQNVREMGSTASGSRGGGALHHPDHSGGTLRLIQHGGVLLGAPSSGR